MLARPGCRALVLLAVLTGGPATAAPRGDDEMLRGPHPFRQENALSVHGGVSKGLDRWLGGTKLFLGYGFKITAPWWLDLQINYQQTSCHRAAFAPDLCGEYRANAAEVLAGVKGKLQLDIPLVPYFRAAAGPVFVFPAAYRSAVGLAWRGGGGFMYFVYDWFGVGAEGAIVMGHLFHDEHYPGTRRYMALDLGFGIELQF